MTIATIYPGTPSGTVKIPASKSLAHRAVICAALASGTSRLHNLSLSNDISATLGGMAALGTSFVKDDESHGESYTVRGVGFPFAASADDECLTVDCGESGSTLRFFIPIFSLTGQKVRFVCHGRLAERPQSVYQDIFAQKQQHFAPFKDGSNCGWELCGSLTPGEYTVKGDVSSQFISGLLFALPLLGGDSTLRILPPFESRSYVELTLEMLQKFGVTATWQSEFELFIPGNQRYTPCNHTVEGDFSQMAFFAVLGAINSEVSIVGLSPTSRQGDKKIVDIIRQMGGHVQEIDGGYSIAPGELSGQAIDLADCPDLGPILTVLGACAKGKTTLFNAERLRIKESDRIADVECELARFGIKTASTTDKLTVWGADMALAAKSCCQAHRDHRIVMALATLATVCQKPVQIAEAEAINKSYPGFFADLQSLGIKVEFSDAE